jgi:hypothetical protein
LEGQTFVLALLGFATTSFIITITLSAADATAHIVKNPFVVAHLDFLHHRIAVTLVLITALGAIFLRGFKEAIGIAVFLVAIYLSLNLTVVAVGFYEITTHATVLWNWKQALFGTYSSPFLMIGTALLVFPKLALGLSGFETGVVVMPLVKGDIDPTHSPSESQPLTRPGESAAQLSGRIYNTRKLLTVAALIMSFLLIASSICTTLLIPAEEFRPETDTLEAGAANGRALAYLAHQYLGDVFGTIYDLSTISILWFAGSSALAGLLNIVPRYLPRYGMAPEWGRATRPLVVVFTLICFAVTILFKADVDAQGGAYATGVLALMTSAAIAVTLSARRLHEPIQWLFMLISLVFIYTTVVNAVPNAIAAFLLFLRNETGKLPHVYFGWSEGNPLSYMLKYIAFGEGDTAPVTHEVLRQAEKDPEQRPIVHVGG